MNAHIVVPRDSPSGLASAKGWTGVDSVESLFTQVSSKGGRLRATDLVEPTAALDAALGIPRCATVTYEEEAEHVVRILAGRQERYSRVAEP